MGLTGEFERDADRLAIEVSSRTSYQESAWPPSYSPFAAIDLPRLAPTVPCLRPPFETVQPFNSAVRVPEAELRRLRSRG
jgi:hypothetical protein